MELVIKKREGGEESWSKDKLISSLTKAGLSVEWSECASSLIEMWAHKNSVDGKIYSSEIRDKVIELLNVLDPVVKDSYAAYKKS